ncbi:hypothetical protein [Glutamicibacter soli]|uniref:hypothetical protein n=1 Tax=Glutamicibacter soli TaxID=453836 RepID=UPI003FD4DEF8
MADLYEFKMRYAQADKTGYYHTRWDQGGVAEVIASTREEAHQKLLTLLGSCPRGFGWGWAVKILSIRDHRIVAKEKTDG